VNFICFNARRCMKFVSSDKNASRKANLAAINAGVLVRWTEIRAAGPVSAAISGDVGVKPFNIGCSDKPYADPGLVPADNMADGAAQADLGANGNVYFVVERN